MQILMATQITTVSQILGHACTKMTLDVYDHFHEGDSAVWADRLGAHFELGAGQERGGNPAPGVGAQPNAS
jgi:hypothetical protein